MDEYNDPDTIRLSEHFFSKSGVDSPENNNNTHRTRSLCMDRGQIVKTTVQRNISSPPAMPGTSQKRFSLRSSFHRLTSGGSRSGPRSDSMRSNNQTRCDDTILETNEVSPRSNLDSNGCVKDEGKKSEERINVEDEEVDLLKPSSGSRKDSNQIDFWLFYFKKCGWTLILVFSVSSCFYQSLKIYSDLWLNEVVDEKEDLKEVRIEFT